jgi:hypothetical protein
MAMMDKMVRRRELPCVRRPRSVYRKRVVRDAEPMSMERKKWWGSEEEATKRNDKKK